MNNIYDAIIIGAGPAGLTSSIYLNRANKKTLVIEKSTPGGNLVNIKDIENYPGYMGDGITLALNMFNQFNKFNGNLVIDEVTNIKLVDDLKEVTTLSNNKYLAKNVIVATGTTYSNLKVAGERKYLGNGISYCAICDGKFYENKIVGVVTNKLESLKEINYLASLASKVILLTNLDFNDLASNVEVIKGYKIKGLVGNNKLEGIVIANDSNQKEIKLDGLFPLIGQLPSNSFLKDFNLFSANGYMIVDSNNQSAIKGIYGVGDVVNKDLRQVVNATSEGAIAAYHIINSK